MSLFYTIHPCAGASRSQGKRIYINHSQAPSGLATFSTSLEFPNRTKNVCRFPSLFSPGTAAIPKKSGLSLDRPTKPRIAFVTAENQCGQTLLQPHCKQPIENLITFNRKTIHQPQKDDGQTPTNTLPLLAEASEK